MLIYMSFNRDCVEDMKGDVEGSFVTQAEEKNVREVEKV
jgi:hypothetical protein